MTSSIDPAAVELGLDTFGDVAAGPDGAPLHQAVVLRQVVDQAVLADRVGLSFIGLGEHHRDDFAITAPDVVLGAIAARTERIHLGSAVTVLSSDDPIRVFESFSTLDALSNGRAEVILGRGSFTESFPLFGFELADYERLFAEKLDLFTALLTEEPVTWSGSIRPPLTDQRVYPPTESGRLKAWIGVGGTPQSVVRAAHYRLPLMLAIIGGPPAQFVPLANYYRDLLAADGVEPLPIGMHSPGHVAPSDEQARDELFPHFQAQRDRIGRERGWPPTTRIQFERDASPEGALYVGSPETVARKIATNMEALGVSRFDLKYANGAMPHEQLMRSIELYGARVAPLVRDMLA
ncbi:LLM class flavin-dependent oxidoreductase [Aeromicrobium sp. 636]|uniref:LLM class flavin-dependent oxidoreductase n=1 Tax=Aeromicrobium senzhongii TaxID=2663859 RepID=A0A8I0EVK4_9ACTN|nr:MULTISPECIES: LLM class flavin-dependent oxidoreductase [Aeromicrobium]MBC9226168.1 LLM class flavin-dependent oxidoreductase [Aeromicrobium senzhongii]MCQ3998274.1 LLM class flavin-dependent oxidoreductase [Aeromicrobium sp. 636]